MNNGTFLNNGIVEAVASALTVNSSVSNNSAGVLTGGTWRVLADTGPATLNLSSNVITNNATILLSGTNATFPQLAGLAVNQNRLTIQNGAALTVTAAITNSGSVNIGANSHLTMNGDYTHSGSNAVTTINGSISFNTGSLNLASGTLNGSGEIAGGLSNGGHVSPGNSPALLTATGNYVQLASGALDIEIGGPTVGTQYDQLHTNGTAQLGGTLNVTLINGFTPTQDNSFVILLSDLGVSGNFATTNLPSGLHVVYDANDVRLVVPEPSAMMLCMLGSLALLAQRRRRRVWTA